MLHGHNCYCVGYTTTQLTTSHKDCITYSTELLSILHFGKPTFSDIHLFGKDLNSGKHSNPISRALSTSLLHSEVEPRGDFWTATGGGRKLERRNYSALIILFYSRRVWLGLRVSCQSQPSRTIKSAGAQSGGHTHQNCQQARKK